MNFKTGLIKMMPKKYRKTQAWVDLFTVFGELLNGVHEKIDGLADLNDKDRCPESYLQYVADQYGVPIFLAPGTTLTERKRIFLKSVPDLIRSKGLSRVIEDLATFLWFSEYSDTGMEIFELWTNDYLNFRVDSLVSEYIPAGWVGDGVTTTFTATVVRPPIRVRSVKITSVATDNSPLEACDLVTGVLRGDVAAGQVTYSSGYITVTFSKAPKSGADIFLKYTVEDGQYLTPHYVMFFQSNIYKEMGNTDVSLSPVGWVGDGSEAFFSTVLNLIPVKPGSVVITALDSLGQTMTVTDDGLGNLIGDVGSGTNTIGYEDGVLSVTFVSPVGAGSNLIQVSYVYQNIYQGRQVVNQMVNYLDKWRPIHTVRHIEVGSITEFWRVEASHWRVGGSGSPAPLESEIIRVGGSIWR